MRAPVPAPLVFAAVLTSITVPARAEQLGFDLGLGPVVASRGSLSLLHDPIIYSRAGLTLHHHAWAADLGVVVMTAPSGDPDSLDRPSVGVTGGLRRYVGLAAGLSNGIRWSVAGYGAAGWTRTTLGSASQARSDDMRAGIAAAVTRPLDGNVVSGPRAGVGLEIALAHGRLWSRMGVDVTHQELHGTLAPGRELDGGYTLAQVAITTSFGRP